MTLFQLIRVRCAEFEVAEQPAGSARECKDMDAGWGNPGGAQMHGLQRMSADWGEAAVNLRPPKPSGDMRSNSDLWRSEWDHDHCSSSGATRGPVMRRSVGCRTCASSLGIAPSPALGWAHFRLW
jgi:hypothetical protein